MKKSLSLFAGLLGLFFGSGCAKNEPIPFPNGLPQFSLHLKKVVRHNDSGPFSSTFTSEYFYNAAGKIDSIYQNLSAYKVLYNASGQVDQLLYYRANGSVGAIDVYEYNAAGLVDKVLRTDLNNATSEFEPSWYQRFEYNNASQVTQEQHYKSNDELIQTFEFTLENGNRIEERHFVPADSEASYYSTAAYNEGWNPYFAAGLNDVAPGAYPVNTVSVGEIVFWCCGDYLPGPITSTYEFNAENLPVKQTLSTGDWIEYFYE